MTVDKQQTKVAQQIAVCDEVLERLAQVDDRTLGDLIADVKVLRASLLASLDGDGSRRST
jgi:hypothetical protein